MTNVLRKKIALSSGIPPSVQNAEPFWCGLRAAVDAWSVRGLELVLESTIVQRKVLTGESATSSKEEGEVLFAIPPTDGFGLSAIVLNRNLAIKLAAKRMHQNETTLEETSDLFLTLICEDPAMLLKESINAHVIGNRHDFNRGIGVDLSYTPTELQPSRRYVQVEVELPIEHKAERIRLLFDFDRLKQYVTIYDLSTDKSKSTIELSEHALIRDHVQKSDVRIDAVLERLHMPFGACSRLKVGQILPLLKADQNAISIAVDTVSGSTDISRGRLGVWRQKRAIKLSAPISGNFVRDLTAY